MLPACAIVIFGAVGDLTHRLLMPSIYNLAAGGLLNERTRIIGADHHERDTAGWRQELGDSLHQFASEPTSTFQGTIDEKAWTFVAERLEYVRFDFTQPADYRALAERLAEVDNVVFYLAVSPRFFEIIPPNLAQVGLLKEQPQGAFRRLVVEKPFGRDLDTARKLNAELASLLSERQIYRVDHFLGKEAVQGIPVLRFANRNVEPLLNREALTSVQITAAETVGVEERGGFFESVGTLRDMVPNHLFSLLTLLAMDAPPSFESEAVRDAKIALLRTVRPIDPADAVRGQYTAGPLNGATVRGYREEDRVAPDSRTETYAALRVWVDNDRWQGVPFYLRTGKRLNAHVTTIALTVRAPAEPIRATEELPHVAAFGIDPQRGFIQRFAAKRPGVELGVGPVRAGFRYEACFDEPPNVGYETLIYHVLRGESLLFQRADMVESCWSAVQPVLDSWSNGGAPDPYTAGSEGPASAAALPERDGHGWLKIAPFEQIAATEG